MSQEPGHRMRLERPSRAGVLAVLRGTTEDTRRIDEFAARRLLKAAPGLDHAIEEEYLFKLRATAALAGAGIGQFLDLECGYFTGGDDVADVALGITPDARILYADTDPRVVAQVRARACRSRSIGPGCLGSFPHDTRGCDPGACPAELGFRAAGVDLPVLGVP